jgi:hypothetical protein
MVHVSPYSRKIQYFCLILNPLNSIGATICTTWFDIKMPVFDYEVHIYIYFLYYAYLTNIRSEKSKNETSTRGRSEPGLYNLRYDTP